MKMRLLVVLSAWMIALSPLAQATTLVRMSLTQLSQASSAIVRGSVVSQETRWNPQHTQILTFTTVAVREVIKGNPPSTLVIEQLGGMVGHIRSWVPGTALLRPQTEYVFFLEPSAANPSRFLPVGMLQGAMRIYREASTRQERVILPLGSLAVSTPNAQGKTGMVGPTLSLGEFRQQVTGAVNAPVTIPRGTSIPVAIDSTDFQGVGRMDIQGHVASDLFPNAGSFIPAGSRIRGAAERVGGKWRIQWTEMEVRGTRVELSASSEEPAEGSLRGTVVIASVR
jgi:hypothetical protein